MISQFRINILGGVSIILLAISIAAFEYTTDTNPRTDQTLIELKIADEELWKQFVRVNENTLFREAVLLELINRNALSMETLQEDHETLTAQITELQAALKTTNENFIVLPEEHTPQKSFYLKTTDSSQNEKNTFGINQVVYINANADDTNYTTVSYAIYSPNSTTPLVTGDKGIPSNGSFSLTWIVPASAENGTYTVTVSDRSISDSITFKVE